MCIDLPDKKMFNVLEFFADQIPNNTIVPSYYTQEDVRISEDTYLLALRLIEQHLEKDNDDILIFVPGMFEIKKLKKYVLDKIEIKP